MYIYTHTYYWPTDILSNSSLYIMSNSSILCQFFLYKTVSQKAISHSQISCCTEHEHTSVWNCLISDIVTVFGPLTAISGIQNEVISVLHAAGTESCPTQMTASTAPSCLWLFSLITFAGDGCTAWPTSSPFDNISHGHFSSSGTSE